MPWLTNQSIQQSRVILCDRTQRWQGALWESRGMHEVQERKRWSCDKCLRRQSMVCLSVCVCVQEREITHVCLWGRRVWEDEGKLRDVKGQEQIDKIFPCDPPPRSSGSICTITPSQHGLSAGPSSHLPETPPMHSCSSCGSPPLPGSSPLPAYYHALRPLLLAPHTHSLTRSRCLGLGVITSPLPGGGKTERKAGEKKKKGNCLENNCSLTPCSDSRGLSFDSDCRHSVKH